MTALSPCAVRASLGRNLTHGMLEMLGQAIVTGAFDTRRFPTEAELALQYGVSRQVTREAVKMLTAKGLLSARPRQGTVIEPVSSWHLLDDDLLGWLLERDFSISIHRQLGELRLAIEPAAAALAAANANAAARRAIHDGYEKIVAAGSDGHDLMRAIISFHLDILEASDNPFFRQFRGVISAALQASVRHASRPASGAAGLRLHHGLARAIEDGDQPQARSTMQALVARGLI